MTSHVFLDIFQGLDNTIFGHCNEASIKNASH